MIHVKSKGKDLFRDQLTEELVSRLAPVTASLIEYFFQKTLNLERRDLERLEQIELLERFEQLSGLSMAIGQGWTLARDCANRLTCSALSATFATPSW
jgi:hypothetical protein